MASAAQPQNSTDELENLRRDQARGMAASGGPEPGSTADLESQPNPMLSAAAQRQGVNPAFGIKRYLVNFFEPVMEQRKADLGFATNADLDALNEKKATLAQMQSQF